MTRVSLKSAIDEGFIKSFQGVAQQRSGADNFAASLKGGSSQVGISTGLRLGAQVFAGSIGGLNSLIGFVNLADNALDKLGDITDEMITLTDRASSVSASSQERRRLNSRFRKLIKEFEGVTEDAQFAERDLLKLPDLKSVFNTLGFDETESQSVSEVFSEFHTVPADEDELLASEKAKGRRPIPVPADAYRIETPSGTKILGKVTTEFDSLFSSQRNLDTRASAYKLGHDLRALKEQISDNKDALATTATFIEENIALVRAAGFAFLDLSQTISDAASASEVARALRKEIRKAPVQALNQLENLEPLAVAALSLDSEADGS